MTKFQYFSNKEFVFSFALGKIVTSLLSTSLLRSHPLLLEGYWLLDLQQAVAEHERSKVYFSNYNTAHSSLLETDVSLPAVNNNGPQDVAVPSQL